MIDLGFISKGKNLKRTLDFENLSNYVFMPNVVYRTRSDILTSGPKTNFGQNWVLNHVKTLLGHFLLQTREGMDAKFL